MKIATGTYATYKGRKYRLLWSGKTKFGSRAKLGFFDGSKEFWVDLAAVSVEASHHRRRIRTPDGELIDEDDVCDLCGHDKYNCGHCIGW